MYIYMTNTFIQLLKKHTTIDKDFINTFFRKFKIGGELNFDIKDIDEYKALLLILMFVSFSIKVILLN